MTSRRKRLSIVRLDRWHAWFSHDQVDGGPQKFHATSTPRIGGLALVAGLAASIVAMDVFGWLRPTAVEGLTLLAMAAIPAFAGGIGEDVSKRVGVFARLMLTISGGVIASLLVGATLDRVTRKPAHTSEESCPSTVTVLCAGVPRSAWRSGPKP